MKEPRALHDSRVGHHSVTVGPRPPLGLQALLLARTSHDGMTIVEANTGRLRSLQSAAVAVMWDQPPRGLM
jgi:hypothetical protein